MFNYVVGLAQAVRVDFPQCGERAGRWTGTGRAGSPMKMSMKMTMTINQLDCQVEIIEIPDNNERIETA